MHTIATYKIQASWKHSEGFHYHLIGLARYLAVSLASWPYHRTVTDVNSGPNDKNGTYCSPHRPWPEQTCETPHGMDRAV